MSRHRPDGPDRPDGRDEDDVALRDLLVGEPAVHRVLDGDAARAKAEQVVRDLGSDPRVADVISRVGDGVSQRTQPGLGDNNTNASVRESAPDVAEASEIQRNTQRIDASKQVTAPKLDTSGLAPGVDPNASDPHRRVTDPRLHQRGPADDAADQAYLAAQRALQENARRAKTDHQRLAVLGASALAVGIILIALVLSGKDKPKPAPTEEPTPSGQIPVDVAPVETVLAPLPPTAPTAPGIAPSPSTPTTSVTPPTAPNTAPSTAPRPPGVETNPKSSAPKPGPGQDAPDPAPKPSSDRPF